LRTCAASIAGGAELERCANAYVAAFPQFDPVRPGDGVVLVVVALSWARHRDYRGVLISCDVDISG
jgi:hypothetical protein